MSKSNKIDLKKVFLIKDDNGIFHVKGLEDEEVPFDNLTEEMEKLIQLNKPLNIKINKARLGGKSNRKLTFKYRCPHCSKEIKSQEENLEAKCMDCNCEFVKINK